MLGSTFDKSIELFDRRFVRDAYLPMLLATAGLAFVMLSGGGGLESAARGFEDLDPIAQGGALLGWLGAAWFMAGMLWNSRYSITRIFEGYTLEHRDGWLGSLRNRLCRRQRNMAEFFAGPTRYQRYPMRPRDFLPTSFGNVMRASELYGHDRYGLNLIVIWPRLAEVAPDRYRNDVDDARSEYEFLLCLSFLGAFFGLVAGAYLIIVGGPLYVYMTAVPTTLGLAYLSYRLAVFAAIDYGDQLRVVVDLYRHEVLASLGWPTPISEGEERTTWARINEFLGQGTDVPGGRPVKRLLAEQSHVEPSSGAVQASPTGSVGETARLGNST